MTLSKRRNNSCSCVGEDETIWCSHHDATGPGRKTDFNQGIFMLLSSPQEGELLVKSFSFKVVHD